MYLDFIFDSLSDREGKAPNVLTVSCCVYLIVWASVKSDLDFLYLPNK